MEQRITNSVKLLLPALMPSWRFFESIGPAPRVEYALSANNSDALAAWQEFRPRPQSISCRQMLKRMVYNPQWNGHLYLTSCAERLIQDPSDSHSAQEISARIQAALPKNAESKYLRFRLAFISREVTGLETHILFESAPTRIDVSGGGDD
tara:strand:+ start:20115 stop:20567 length:453 start_codon:yes stop_codon:yes gene_type:complete